LNSTLKFSGDVIDITDGQLTSDLTHTGFQGKYNFKADDKVDLEFKGDRIVIDELLPETDNKSPDFKTFMSQSPFFPAATGRVRFDLKHLNFKLLKLDNVSGIFTLEKEKFKIDTLDIGKEKEIRVRGLISINENNEEVIRGLVQAKNTKVERFLGLFGDIFDNSLTGDLKNLDLRFQSKGKGMPKLEDTIEAKIVFDLASGKMNVEKLKKGTFKLFNVKSIDGPAETSPEKDESLFTQIAGKFTLLKGVAKTEDFIFETVDRRTSLVGKFDLRQHQIDAVAGVAPLAALDKFLTKIPLVGKIITGGDEKSLMKSYYTVKGKFSDPEISAIPFTSLTKKVVGIFQGILQTPQSLFPEVSEEPAN
jgi:hypothetical protein